MHQTKIKVMIVMIIMIVFMAVGYALLSTSLNINGSTAVTSNWQVEFSDIRTVEQKGGATNKIIPTVSKTTANFEVDLVQPGDEITYEIDITNYGDIEAEVKGATYTSTGSEAIYVRFEGIRKGTRIASCEGESTCPKVTVIVKVGYDASVTSDPEEKTKDISITLDIGQYVSSNPTPDGELLPELKLPTLPEKILNDNSVQSDSSIDFSKTSEEDGTKGLYYTNTNTEDNKTTYYFRGAVENNYVYFANYYWRIIRINEDGSIRLIYQGKQPESFGEDSLISTSIFNSNDDDNAYVGYMYGTPSSSTYSATHSNTNDSAIKVVLDQWYEANLINYQEFLEDSGFCGDRSIEDSELGYGNNVTYYGFYNRIEALQPQFACPQENDLYTTSNSSKGNQALDYPIGLITADEVMYAGSGVGQNMSYYLYNMSVYWTMTPASYSAWIDIPGANILTLNIVVTDLGMIFTVNPPESFGIRPVINLKSSVLVSSGDGTQNNPYIIS